MPTTRMLAALATALAGCLTAALGVGVTSVGPAAAAEPGGSADRSVHRCDGRVATIVGTSERETIEGTPGDDVIVGLAGRDHIEGRGGDDRICGGVGSDFLYGGPGDDRVFGQRDGCAGPGGCAAVGNGMVGGPGDDLLAGRDRSAPDTVLFPVAKRGVVVDLTAGTAVGDGHDRLVGVGNLTTTPYDDEVRGLEGDGRLDTGEGDDLVTDIARGWHGELGTYGGDDDVVKALPGSGNIFLGDDDDTVSAMGGTVYDGPGDDTITAVGELTGARGLVVHLGYGDDVVEGSAGEERVDIFEVPGTDDGTEDTETLDLRGGDDVVDDSGSEGRMVLDAGEGDDTVTGGAGDDEYDAGPGTDLIGYGSMSGFDSGAEIDLAEGTASGLVGTDVIAGFEDATGTPQDDVIRGDDGPNELTGLGGADELFGRAGDDVLLGGAGVDAADGGADTDTCVAETATACEG